MQNSRMIDIRDSVSHLRTIHFSLIVSCLALIGLTVSDRNKEFDLALAQLAEIQDVASNWDRRWLESAAAAHAAQQASGPASAFEAGVECEYICGDLTNPLHLHIPDVAGLNLRTSGNWTMLPLPEALLALAITQDGPAPPEPGYRSGPLWSRMADLPRRDPQFLQPVPTEYPIAFEPLELPRPNTLGDFEAIWDALASLSVTVTVPGSDPYNERPNWIGIKEPAFAAPVVQQISDTPAPDWPDVHLQLEPMSEFVRGFWRDRTEHELLPDYHYIGHTPWGEVQLPVLVESVPLNTLSAFIGHYGLTRVRGSFAVNFPELVALTVDETAYGLDTLQALLISRSERAQDDIELFGLVIPSVLIARWGGLIILIVQLYFFLHLRALRDQIGQGRDAPLAPWIGIYPDRISKTAAALSACALPPAVLAFIIVPDIAVRPIPEITYLALVLLLSVGLCTWSFGVMKDLWRLCSRVRDAA